MSVDLPTPETIEVAATVTAEVAIAALRAAGATVVWLGDAPSATRLIEMKATVDAHDAYDELPAWMLPDEEPDWTEPDRADLADFIGACIKGDRRLAMALLPRLNVSPASSFAGERLLLSAGATAC